MKDKNSSKLKVVVVNDGSSPLSRDNTLKSKSSIFLVLINPKILSSQ